MATLNSIKTIGKKMEIAIGEYFKKQGKIDPTKNFQWEYILVDDDKMLNAWCMQAEK